jgi:hypothetical protein
MDDRRCSPHIRSDTLASLLSNIFEFVTKCHFASLIAAQRFFWASAIFRFVAALKGLRFMIGATGLDSGATVIADATGFFGGRPRRLRWRSLQCFDGSTEPLTFLNQKLDDMFGCDLEGDGITLRDPTRPRA